MHDLGKKKGVGGREEKEREEKGREEKGRYRGRREWGKEGNIEFFLCKYVLAASKT